MSGQDAGEGTKERSIGEREALDSRAREGETVVPGGTGGGDLDAQERLAEGRKKGESGEERAKQEGIAVNPLDPKECKTCKD